MCHGAMVASQGRAAGFELPHAAQGGVPSGGSGVLYYNAAVGVLPQGAQPALKAGLNRCGARFCSQKCAACVAQSGSPAVRRWLLH
jgi:hypothetical protein